MALLLAVLIAGVLFIFLRLRAVLTPFALAVVLAYVLHPFVCLFERRSVPRGAAIVILYVGLALVTWCGGKLLLPGLTRELHELAQTLPEQTERLEGFTRRTAADVRRIQLPATLEEMGRALRERVEHFLEAFAARLGDLLVRLMSSVVSFVLAPVLAFYLLRDWAAIRVKVLRALPLRWRRHVVRLGDRVNRVLHGYIRGQLFVSAAVGALAAVGLSLFGIPYALVIGLLAGLFDLIPYFGPVIGTMPGVALALMESPRTALYVLLMFVAIQQFESAVLSPKVVGHSVGLHPVTVILVVLAGAELFGLVGMVLAVPFAGTLKAVWEYVCSARRGGTT